MIEPQNPSHLSTFLDYHLQESSGIHLFPSSVFPVVLHHFGLRGSDLHSPCFVPISKQGGNNWGPLEFLIGFHLNPLFFRTHKHSFGKGKCVLTSAKPQNFPPAAGCRIYKYSSNDYFSPPQAKFFGIWGAEGNYFPPCYGRSENKGEIIQGIRLIWFAVVQREKYPIRV